MKLKITLILSIIACGISIVYIIGLLRQDFVFNRELSDVNTINVWTTTPGLSLTLEGFNTTESLKVTVKQFRDFDSLLEMLELAKLNHELPDLVEIDSHYGMYEVMARTTPLAFDNIVKDIDDYHPSIIDSFEDDNHLYAYPLGIEIPLLYMGQAVINNGTEIAPYPFQGEEQIAIYKEIQDKINEKNLNKTFRFFHFNSDIPWYWEAFKVSKGRDLKITFDEAWHKLAIDYELIPILENHKAITKFTNVEAGVLITGSKNLLTVQQLIGNNFEFEVRPFTTKIGDPILINGSGLINLTENNNIPKLLDYLGDHEVQLELMGKTGWLPAKTTLLQNESFIQRLPMSKYISKLVINESDFVGQSFEGNSREKWLEIINKMQTIEGKKTGEGY